MGDLIKVAGLKEFQRGLKRMDSDLPKALRVSLNGVADFLITKTKPLIPRRSGAAAASLKAKSTQTSARISVGGRKAPYYPWLDFGGRTGRRKSVVRPFYREGRYIYPTLAKHADDITDLMGKAVVAVAEGSGIKVD